MPAILERPPTVLRPVPRPPMRAPQTLQRAPRRRWLVVAVIAVVAAGVGAGTWALVDHYTGTPGATYVAPDGAPAIPAFDPSVVAQYGAPDPWMLAATAGGVVAYATPIGSSGIAAFDPGIIARYGPADPWMYALTTRYVAPAGAPSVAPFDPVVIAQYGPPDPWMLAAFTGGFD